MNKKCLYKINDDEVRKILANYGNINKFKILMFVGNKSKSLLEIVNNTNIAPATCYRNSKSLIMNNILVENGKIELPRGKNIMLYTCMFSIVKINIEKNFIEIFVKINTNVNNKKMLDNFFKKISCKIYT